MTSVGGDDAPAAAELRVTHFIPSVEFKGSREEPVETREFNGGDRSRVIGSFGIGFTY